VRIALLTLLLFVALLFSLQPAPPLLSQQSTSESVTLYFHTFSLTGRNLSDVKIVVKQLFLNGSVSDVTVGVTNETGYASLNITLDSEDVECYIIEAFVTRPRTAKDVIVANFSIPASEGSVETPWGNYTIAPNATLGIRCNVTDLSVRVVDMLQQPYRGATVTAESNALNLRITNRTRENGCCLLLNIPFSKNHTTYNITVSKAGLAVGNTSLNLYRALSDPSLWRQEQPVNVTVVGALYNLTISVIDRFGNPISDAVVSIVDTVWGEVVANTTGGIWSQELQISEYSIMTYLHGVLLNSTLVLLNESKVVTVQCLDYPLSLTVVVDAANGPLAGAKVRVEGPITVEGTTNGEGRCMLSNLVAGSYYVSVFYGDSLVSSRWIHLGSDTTIHLHIDAYLIGSFQLSPHLLQVCIYTVLFAIALLIFWNRSRVVDLLKRLKR